MFNRIIHKEDGVTMVLALAFMAVSVPIITAALGLASTLTVDSTVKSQIARDQFSQIGADELAIEMLDDEDYLLSLWDDDDLNGEPDGDEFIVTLNDDDTFVEIDPGDPNISPVDGEGLVVTKTVFPFFVAAPSTPSVHTYTIRVENTTDHKVIPLNWMHDGLPEGFEYVDNSVTSPDFDVFLLEPPIETWRDKFDPDTGLDAPAYLQISWDLNPAGITLQPGQVLNMSFDAAATTGVPEGQYCNIAWVEPEGSQTRTGATARITVGNPPDSVCASEKGDVDTSVTAEPDPLDPTQINAIYVVPIVNTSNQSLHLWWVRLKLPDDFTYIEGSTGGTITANDPLPVSQQGRRQVLNWIWDGDKPTIPSWVDDRFLTFDAIAPTTPGTYFIESTVFFKEFDDQAYSWPDAVVKVMDTYEITVTDGGNSETSTTVFLLGTDAEVVYNGKK